MRRFTTILIIVALLALTVQSCWGNKGYYRFQSEMEQKARTNGGR